MNVNTQTSSQKGDKSISALISNLTEEISTLFRQEVGLVKTEMSEKAGQAQSGLMSMIIGGAVAYAGLLILLFAAVLGLALYMDAWLAALIVAGVVLIIGISMVGKGKSDLKARNLMPRKTMDSLRSDKRLTQEHTA